MTCKDCYNYDLCVCHEQEMSAMLLKGGYRDISNDMTDSCRFFKNKANVLKIPDTDIIYTKDKWLVLNMENEDLGAAIKYIVDYCTKNTKMNGVGYIDD